MDKKKGGHKYKIGGGGTYLDNNTYEKDLSILVNYKLNIGQQHDTAAEKTNTIIHINRSRVFILGSNCSTLLYCGQIPLSILSLVLGTELKMTMINWSKFRGGPPRCGRSGTQSCEELLKGPGYV